jgi:hypothetical protein
MQKSGNPQQPRTSPADYPAPYVSGGSAANLIAARDELRAVVGELRRLRLPALALRVGEAAAALNWVCAVDWPLDP